MTMLWLPCVLLFIALLAFFWRKNQTWRLSQELSFLRWRLDEEDRELQNTVNNIIQCLDKTLDDYRPVLYDRAAMEALALDNLAEDLRIMSKLGGYGEGAKGGWGQAFDVLAEYRARLIVGRVALSASASDEFKEGMDKLVDNLKGFEMLRGFRRTHMREHAPYELSNQRWPHLQLAQLQVADMQEQARNLMELLEQDKWRAVPQS